MSPIETIVDLIDAAGASSDLVLVGIGGHGGAGKSTLAARLVDRLPGAQVVPTDAFWNGRQFDLPRLRAGVVDELLAGRSADYPPWNWAGDAAGTATTTVTAEGVVIIEGVCALHEMFRYDLAVRVWVDAPADVRLARGVARDGERSRGTWLNVWMPNEDAYVARDRPVECAHLIVDGTADTGS